MQAYFLHAVIMMIAITVFKFSNPGQNKAENPLTFDPPEHKGIPCKQIEYAVSSYLLQ